MFSRLANDVVFQQNYGKLFVEHGKNAYQAGVQCGQFTILNAIAEFEAQKIPVTLQGLIEYLNSQVEEEQSVEQQKESAQPAEVKHQKPKFEVIK